MQTVVVSGIRGQIASYAAEKFLNEGFNVVGLYRRCSMQDFSNIKHLFDNPNFQVYEADICDMPSIAEVVTKFKPDIFLNFAAQSHVGSSYKQPITTAEVDYLAVAKILEVLRTYSQHTKFWNANTSERFGLYTGVQNEETPPYPVSPYSCAKTASEYLIKSYNITYGMHASYSIMFNSESPRRSKEFVTRKITNYIGETWNVVDKNIDRYIGENFTSSQQCYEIMLANGLIKPLKLGNLDTYRSWTHCKDTVDGIYKQVMLDKPDVFVFGREETHSIREFLTEAFGVVGVSDWSKFVVQDPQFMRPSDVPMLKPDCAKAKNLLGWEPKISFKELVKEMVENDIRLNS